jgi:hypothetical protein
MGSIAAARYCANGKRCVAHPQTGKPTKLRSSSTDEICGPCREVGRGTELTPVGHEVLFRAARALLDNKVEGEHTIIPTLVLAAAIDKEQQLKHQNEFIDQQYKRVGDAVVEAYGSDDAWEEVEKAFLLAFQGVEPCAPVDGVPVIQIPPIGLSVLPDKSDSYVPLEGDTLVKGVILDVYKGTVEPEEIADLYMNVLRLFSLPHTSTVAVFACELTDTGLQMIVRPAEEDPDLHPGVGSVRHPNIISTSEGSLKKRQPAFPEPAWVAAIYGGLKAQRFAPPKRGGGSPQEPENLIPAVVAFYMGGRSQTLDNTEKGKITELVRRYLLESRRDSNQANQRLNLWRTLELVLPKVQGAEARLMRRVTRLRKYF